MIFKRSTYYKILVVLLVSFNGIAQPTLKFKIADYEGLKDDIVCVDIRVENFVDIISMQFNISYNATLVSPIEPIDFSTSALSPNIDNGNFNLITKDNGYIKFLWDLYPGVTLPDGSLLFTICFKLIGDPGNISPIYVNNLLIDVEICSENIFDGKECADYLESDIGKITIKSNTLQAFVNRCDADVNNPANGGSATFYAVGGTPPYTYLITPGGYSGTLTADGQRETIPGLPMDNYTLLITDANGLTTTKMFNVSSNLPIVVDEVVKDPTCFYKRNGSINLTVSGGLGPYKYEWSNYVSNVDFNKDLLPGKYNVTVTDFNGCEVVRDYKLTADTIKFDLAIIDSTSCQEVKDGVITISNVQGGTHFSGVYDYTHIINNTGSPQGFTDPVQVGKIAGGLVRVIVADSFACRVEKTIVMPVKKPFEYDYIELKNISCPGEKDGSVMIRATPGANYSYLPDDKMTNTGNLGGTFIALDLEAGFYTISGKSLAGCSVQTTFEIVEPAPLAFNDVVVQPDCNNKGSITLNTSGGTGAYTYNWSTGNGNVSYIDDIAIGGTFVVTVTDENQCSTTKSFVISDYGSLAITVESKDVTCQGRTDGTATVDVISSSGQVPMFTVYWKDANGNDIFVGPTTITNLPPGNYIVVVVDNSGCSSTPKSFTINDAPELTIITNISKPLCFNEDGTITASVNGSVTGYTFEWTVKGDNQVIDNDNILIGKAGTYVLKIKSQAGCENEQEIIMTEPAKIEFGVPDLRKETCFGLSNGQAAILSGPANYNYKWSSGSMGQFSLNLPSGPGWVVASLGGCISDTVYFVIDSYPKLEIDGSKTAKINPTCFGDTNGSITVEATGGTGIGYKYIWEGGAQSPLLTNIGAGSYIITISDNNNCEQTDTITLTQPELLEVFLDNVKSVDLDCNNTDNGKIALSTRGGNPGIKQVQWQSGVNTEGAVAINLIPGTYCATVTDNLGCSATFCHTLVAPVPLKGKIKTPAEPICFGDKTCISVDYITGGTGNAYTFQINNGKRYPIDTCVTAYAGQYFISLIDSAGCSIDTTIIITQPNPITVSLGDDKDIQLGLPTAQITPYISSSVGIDNFVWTPNEYINCLDIDCTTVEMSPPVTTSYLLTVTDANGCVGRDEITIRVREVRNVYFANAFTPNSDGYNDYFQAVIGLGVERIQAFTIFDRWGNRVFLKENYVPDPAGIDGWDGTFQGRKLNPGVFVYYAKALFIDGKEIEYSGSVTLIDSDRN